MVQRLKDSSSDRAAGNSADCENMLGMAIPRAMEVSGDVVAAATTLAGLVLVFLGATFAKLQVLRSNSAGNCATGAILTLGLVHFRWICAGGTRRAVGACREMAPSGVLGTRGSCRLCGFITLGRGRGHIVD